MPLLDRIQGDLVAAMRAKDEPRLSTLRLMKTALQKYTADTMKPVDEAAGDKILKSLVKQRIDASEAFRNGGRAEMAAKEEAERKIIEEYLPASATDTEIDDAISAAIAGTGAAGAKQMGAVIKAAQAALAGKTVDGKTLSEKVKARLQ